MQATLISQAEYARRRNVDPTTVRDAVRYGRITLINGKVDPAVADIQWANNTRARVSRQPMPAPERSASAAKPEAAASAAAGDPAQLGYSDHRARREKAEADEAELRVARMGGKLIDRDVVETAVFEAFRTLRDRCLAAGPNFSQRVAGIGDPVVIEREYANTMRAALGLEEHVRLAVAARVAP